MNDRMDVSELKKRLPDMPDEELVSFKEDIETDPDGFAAHVGLNGAAEFLTSLLLEMGDRGLVDLDDPKEMPDRGQLNSSSVRSSTVRNHLSVALKAVDEPLPLPSPAGMSLGNRKQRRAQEARARRMERRLKK